MAGANSVIRVIAAPIVLSIVIFCAWVGVKLQDAITTSISGPPASLGWPAIDYFYTYMALGLAGLMIVIFVWLIVARIRSDTRQELQQRPF